MVIGGLVGVIFGVMILVIIFIGWGVLGYVVLVCLIMVGYVIF